MKSKRNTLISNTLMAIGLAAAMFIIAVVVFEVNYNGSFQSTHYAFSKMAAGTLAIGLGFGLPTFIYENDNLSLPVQILIHIGTGCVVMTVTSFLVGWITPEQGVLAIICTLVGQIIIAFVIWLFFYAHQKKLAKEINQRIKENQQNK